MDARAGQILWMALQQHAAAPNPKPNRLAVGRAVGRALVASFLTGLGAVSKENVTDELCDQTLASNGRVGPYTLLVDDNLDVDYRVWREE